MPDGDTVLLEEESRVLRDAVQVAGETALRFFRNDPMVSTKRDNTPVSEADIAADAILMRLLSDNFADYGWISEESAFRPAQNGSRTWIVDPLDGTRAFVKGREDWSVSVALIEEGRPVIAAIFCPCSGDLYEASAGQGAFVNGKRLRTSEQNAIEGCRMIGYQDLFRSRKWTRPWPAMKVEIFNSMAVRLAYMAAGRCDAVLTINAKSDWDLAAADLLVQEAGGNVTDIDGVPFKYGKGAMRKPNVLASGAMLHGKLLDQLRGWTGSRS